MISLMQAEPVAQQGGGLGGILLLIIIALIVYIVIKRLCKININTSIDKEIFSEEKHMENNLFRMSSGMKMYKQKSSEDEFFNIDNYVNIPKREITELDQSILNIIRVGANKTSILAAYNARKKCIELFKKQTSRVDSEEYVDTLILDFYPNEFKKAEQEKKFLPYLLCCILFIIPSIISGFIILDKVIYYGINEVYIWDSLLILVLCAAVFIYFALKIKKITQLSNNS